MTTSTPPREQQGLNAMEYSPKEMKEILAKVQEIAKTLRGVDEIIGAKRIPATQPPTTESETKEKKVEKVVIPDTKQGEMAEPDNVYYICPHIVEDFKLIEDQTLPVAQLVELYSSWSETLLIATTLNQAHLRNKALRRHLEESYRVCKSLSHTFDKNKGK